jgi:IS5 family transposase
MAERSRGRVMGRWTFNLADPAVEETLYDSLSLRQFAGIDLGNAPVPDETTICKFRHLLERHGLGPKVLHEVNAHSAECGIKIARGTIVDATIISARAAIGTAQNRTDSRGPRLRSAILRQAQDGLDPILWTSS